MSNERGSPGEELCVIFEEAVAWIANRSFSGALAFGPRPLGQLPFNDEDDDEYCIELGSRKLAELLLVDYAAKGRIRIYARDGDTNNDETNDLLKFPVQLISNSLSRAILFETDKGYIIMVGDEEYNYLAVHYDDLIREFWGNIAPITTRAADVRPAPGAVPLRRRGRRPRYPWPDFAAELVRRSISGLPIANQAALEEHMLECATPRGVRNRRLPKSENGFAPRSRCSPDPLRPCERRRMAWPVKVMGRRELRSNLANEFPAVCQPSTSEICGPIPGE